MVLQLDRKEFSARSEDSLLGSHSTRGTLVLGKAKHAQCHTPLTSTTTQGAVSAPGVNMG